MKKEWDVWNELLDYSLKHVVVQILFTPKEEQNVILKRKGKYFLFVVTQL